MALSAPHPAVIREHILTIMRPTKIPVQKAPMVSLRTPEPVKTAEVNPLKHMAKVVDKVPKLPKNPSKFAG